MIRPTDLSRGAPDEADALRRAERLFDAAAQSGLDLTDLDEPALRIATLACQRAPYLATLLARDPHRLSRVAYDPYLTREKPREVLAAEVGRELSRLADGCFDAAIAACDAELRARYGPPRYVDDEGREHDARLAVIGMGKLGGEEL